MSDSRQRTLSASPSFFRSASTVHMHANGGGAGGAHASGASANAAGAAAGSANAAAAGGVWAAQTAQNNFWTHNDIDYSWRFPYPEHQQKEFYDARTYLDEETRRKQPLRTPSPPEAWRSRERMRTQCAALVACLNIGVDPPDVVKPSPCARMECWVDPDSMLPAKALKAIGGRLQIQYERWHERARYKVLLDPTAEELRKALISLRRAAVEERVLLHYNGHGVPRPTGNGEIWVYNKGFTQYIPVSLYDLQTWMGGVQAPTAYVFDCSHAGIIVDAFQHFIKQRRDKLEAKLKQQQNATSHGHKNVASSSSSSIASAAASSGDESEAGGVAGAAGAAAGTSSDEAAWASLQDPCRHILLAACGANESLPMNPDLPADLFTSCLTSPIKMALRWFVSRSLLNTHANNSSSAAGLSGASFSHLSGAAVAGGLAGAPPQSNRQRLYDLIDKLPGMRKPSNRKTPYGELNWIFTAITDSIAWNVLPRPLFHKLFRQDLLISSLFRNFLLAQRILASYHCGVISVPALAPTHTHPLWACWDLACDFALSQLERLDAHATPFTPTTFFEEQLTSFEIWLEFGSAAKPPPMQLPVVLQVLLSTDHRLRALQLLARFVDKGLWAINLALSVGIFPYVLKLLQSPSKELREVLVFIWAKILALDRSVQADLSKIEYATYFIQHLLRFDAGPALARSTSRASAKGQHSRNSSVSPSPFLHPMHGAPTSLTSTPAFHGYAPPSNGSSTTATPLVHAMNGDVTPQGQFPHRTFPHAQTSASDASPNTQLAAQRSGNLPPLDLPPSNEHGHVAAHHTTAQQVSHIHMRAQPLHDPSARLAEGEAHADPAVDEQSTAHLFPSALPPMHPQPLSGQRVPFPLDLTAPPANTSSISPLHSPSISTKPSPQLGGIPYSPHSPMLSPQPRAHDRHAGEEKHSQMPDSSDANDLTRLAREILATSQLQHLLSVFIIACIAHHNPKGQQTLLQSGLSFRDLTAVHLLHSPDHRLRRWSCLAIAKLWQGFGHAKSLAAQDQTPEQLCQLIMDPQPNVRCAALYALGCFFGGKTAPPVMPGASASPTHAQRQMHLLRAQQRLDLEVQLGAIMSTLINDGSPVVRRELMIALAELVYFQLDLFLSIATAHPRSRESISAGGCAVWKAILRGCRDCSEQVQEAALAVKQYLKGRAVLNQSQFGRMIGSQQHPGLQLNNRERSAYGSYVGGALHENIDEAEENSAYSSRRASTASRDTSPHSHTRSVAPSTDGASTTAAPSSTTHVSSEQSLAHIDHDDAAVHGDDAAPPSAALMGHDFHDRDSASHAHAAQLHAQQQKNAPPMRHFNRFSAKMGHLRPASGPGGASAAGGSASALGGAGGQRRSTDKTSILKSMESPDISGGAKSGADGSGATSVGTLDERASDAMWQVPKSRLFEDSYAQLSDPLLVASPLSSASSLPVPSMSEIRLIKWRHARNTALQSHARELLRSHPAKSSYVEVAFLSSEWESTSCVTFHPYETLLFASDSHSTVGVFNYSPEEERGKEKLNSFSNENPGGTKITQLELINDLSVSLLLAASDDGVVRIWRGVHEEGRQQLVTAWVANPQPEVFYSAPAAVAQTSASTATTAQGTPATATGAADASMPPFATEPQSAHTPAARLAGRNHSGVGMPPAQMSTSLSNAGGLSASMRHSASTPALALSVGGTTAPSAMGPLSAAVTANVGSFSMRSGSVLQNSGANFLPSPGSMAAAQRSPSLHSVGAHSPSQQGHAGAMNIPNLSLSGNNQQQRMSPSQSSGHLPSQAWPTSTSSRRKQKPPLIVEWQQQRGVLLASGNGLETMRVWNVEQELCISDIPLLGHDSIDAHPLTHATSIASNGAEMAWVGCADGAVRCFDLRLSPLDALVSSAYLHRSPVQSVRLQRHGQDGGMLISASVGGDIALADVRMDAAVIRYHRGSHKDRSSVLSAFAVHDYSGICASGSPKPFIEVFDHAGITLDTIRYHVGFLGQRIGPITSLAFHRHKLLLAAGSMDSHISIFAGEKNW